ncbi:MAG: hypothetical protein KIT00_03635 [Rhodospirillales bacterium]|nr:hypothetical protein [Rhodospirillales bacterium]
MLHSALLQHPKVAPLLSSEHFSVGGTLVEAWVSRRTCRHRASPPPPKPDPAAAAL